LYFWLEDEPLTSKHVAKLKISHLLVCWWLFISPIITSNTRAWKTYKTSHPSFVVHL